MIRAPGRTLQAQLVYFWVLVRRFKLTFFSLALLVLGGGTVMWRLYAHIGQPISWSRAAFAAYFLLFAQPTMDIPDYGPLEALCTLIPPLGIVTVAEGLVRFAFLFFAKTRNDKEWFAVLAQTLKDHVIVCGAGRVGFRVFEQFVKLDVPMVVIERAEEAPFVSPIRAQSVPVLAAPALAAAALDPQIRNSFEVGGRLMVIAELQVDALLEGQTVADLRDQSSTLVLHLLQADGTVRFDPPGAVRLGRGDRLTVQATLSAYRALRARMERAA